MRIIGLINHHWILIIELILRRLWKKSIDFRSIVISYGFYMKFPIFFSEIEPYFVAYSFTNPRQLQRSAILKRTFAVIRLLKKKIIRSGTWNYFLFFLSHTQKNQWTTPNNSLTNVTMRRKSIACHRYLNIYSNPNFLIPISDIIEITCQVKVIQVNNCW